MLLGFYNFQKKRFFPDKNAASLRKGKRAYEAQGRVPWLEDADSGPEQDPETLSQVSSFLLLPSATLLIFPPEDWRPGSGKMAAGRAYLG